MRSTSRTPGPRRNLILIGAVVIAIVAVGAAASAFLLLEGQGPQQVSDEGSSVVDDSGADDSAADGDGASNDSADAGTPAASDDSGSNTSLNLNSLKQGDYVEYSASSSVLGMSQSGTVRLVVTSATASGYDIVMTITTGSGVEEKSFHASNAQELISGVAGDSFSRGELIGEEAISTIYGEKKVEHWRSTTFEGGTTNVTDYYVGKNTDMVYRAVIVSTGNDLIGLTTTTTLVISNTNIEWVKTGDL